MGDRTPKVSIIMPSLNTADYIDEALRSAVRQTLEDIEIICVDAGSDDGTYDIIQSYAQRDSRIKVYTSDVRSYGFQMNLGLEAATGEFIGIIEPDDYVALDMFSDLYDIACEHELDFVKADFYRFTRDAISGDMHLVYNHLSQDTEDYWTVFCPNERLKSYFYIMNTWSGIYRRSFIEKFNIRHNETPGASYQDNGFFFQTFAHATRAMIVDHPYYMNRRDNPNSSMSNPGKVDAVRVEYDFIRDKLKEEPELWEHLRTVHCTKRFDNYIATAYRIDPALKHNYVLWLSDAMNKLEESGEMTFADVPEDRQSFMRYVMNDPEGWYFKAFVESDAQRRIAELEDQVARLEHSLSFRAGRVFTWLPRKVRDAVNNSRRPKDEEE